MPCEEILRDDSTDGPDLTLCESELSIDQLFSPFNDSSGTVLSELNLSELCMMYPAFETFPNISEQKTEASFNSSTIGNTNLELTQNLGFFF